MSSFEEMLVQEQRVEQKRQERIGELKEKIRQRLGTQFDAQRSPQTETLFNGLTEEDLTADLIVLIASLMSELTNAGLDRDQESLKKQLEVSHILKDGKSVLGEEATSIDLAPNTHMGLQIEEFPDTQNVPGKIYAWMSANLPTIGGKRLNLGHDIAKPLADAGIPLSASLRNALWESIK